MDVVLERDATRMTSDPFRAGLDTADGAREIERVLFERSPLGAFPLIRSLGECRRTGDCGTAVAEVALRVTGRDRQ